MFFTLLHFVKLILLIIFMIHFRYFEKDVKSKVLNRKTF